MRTRHARGAVLAGIVLAAVGVGPPAQAISAMPDSAALSGPGISITAAPTTSAVPSAKKPHKAHKTHRTNHGRSKHAAAPPKHQTAPKTAAASRTPPTGRTAPAATAARTRASSLAASGTARGPHTAPQTVRRDSPEVFGGVTGAVHAAFNLFGWNLLALIPLAGIAFAISRRLRSRRASSIL